MRTPSKSFRVSDLVSAGINAHQALIGVAMAVLLVLAMLLPLPSVLLDLLLALSIGAAAGVLLVALVTSDPLRLTSMPPVLVLTGLMRIVLCVSASRLILMGGGEGTLVATLGVAAGGADPIVAVGLLVVLGVVHIVMVTGGVGRMAEVAARFALDAVPGKQMGLDTAVAAGHLSADGARQQMLRLEAEASFYGAMDGAGRLLRGEAIAALVIVAITGVVGIAQAIGAGMEAGEALSRYAMLITGQGLLTLLPAIVMGAGAALMVSRSASSAPLIKEVGTQMLSGPLPLTAAAVVLVGLGLFPGVAKLPTLGAGALLALAAFAILRFQSDRSSGPAHREDGSQVSTPELILELGMGLVELAEDSEDLMEMLLAARRTLSMELGLTIPAIEVRDSLELGATEFAIVHRAARLERGVVRSSGILAIPPNAGVIPDQGSPGELSDGRRGVWVSAPEAAELAEMGFTLMSPLEALKEELVHALRKHAAAILDLERASKLLGTLRRQHPTLVATAEQAGVTKSLFRRVCRQLLRQGIPLKDPASVLEGIVEALPETEDAEQIALRVRPSLAGVLSRRLAAGGRIRAVTMAHDLHEELADAALREDGRTVAAMMPTREAAWTHLLRSIGIEHGWGKPLAVIAEPRSLLVLQALCRRAGPHLMAVRATDLASDMELDYAAKIEASQLA